MPYIKDEDKKKWGVTGYFPVGPGELNYHITCLLVEYLGDNYNYAKINEVMGVLGCVQAELYRRIAVPYEEQKRFDNGDIFGET